MNDITNIILTGDRHCGKSSLVREIIDAVSVPMQGLFSTAELRLGHVVGYRLRTLHGQDFGAFAHIDFHSNRQFDKFGCFTSPFLLGADYIRKSIRELARLFVIDEIGVMEQHVVNYSKALEELLDAAVPALVVVQNRATWFWQKIEGRNDMIIFDMRKESFSIRTQMINILQKQILKDL